MASTTKSPKKVISGLAFHCHHDKLYEYVFDFDERVDYIKTEKPIEERELRLRLFRMIPTDRLPYEMMELNAQRDKLNAQRDKLYAQLSKLDVQLGELDVQLGELDAQQDKFFAQLDKLYAQLNKLNAQRDKLNARLDKLCAQLNKLNAQRDKLNAQLDKLYVQRGELNAKYTAYFEELHKELCLNCPWDGKTIFPKEDTVS